MGYVTNYTLTQERNPIDEDIFADLIKADEDARYCLNEDGTTCEGCKWYEHEKSLLAFSAAHPEVLFKLHGDGEGSGDLWDKYFVGGKQVHEEKLKTDLPVPDYDKFVPDLGRSKKTFTRTVKIAVDAFTAEEADAKIKAKLADAKITGVV